MDSGKFIILSVLLGIPLVFLIGIILSILAPLITGTEIFLVSVFFYGLIFPTIDFTKFIHQNYFLEGVFVIIATIILKIAYTYLIEKRNILKTGLRIVLLRFIAAWGEAVMIGLVCLILYDMVILGAMFDAIFFTGLQITLLTWTTITMHLIKEKSSQTKNEQYSNKLILLIAIIFFVGLSFFGTQLESSKGITSAIILLISFEGGLLAIKNGLGKIIYKMATAKENPYSL